MNLETINKWLDEEYGCSYTKLEELHDFYFEKYCDLKQENQELKKQLENKYSKTGIITNEVLYEENTKLINQQKEFIEYLENCINELKKESMNKLQNTINLGIVDITKEILSKYKKIIGSDINVGSIGGKE